MSSGIELPRDLSNDEIRRRLTNVYKVECGPVTPSTRRVLLKKLIKLENEQNPISDEVEEEEGDDLNNQSVNEINESLVINGKGDESNGHYEINDLNEQLNEVKRPQRRQSPRRFSPRRKTNEEIEAINSFNEIKNMKKKQSVDSSRKGRPSRHITVKNATLNDSVSKLNEYSSNESSDSDENENNAPSISLTPPRLVSPLIYNGESFKSTLTRPPIRRLNFENKTVQNLSNYSDSESEVEDVKSDKICKMLLSHRPGLGRVQTIPKPTFFSKVSSMFLNLKNKIISFQGEHSNNNFSASSNYISLALLIFVVIFFVVIFSVYFYAKFTLTSKHAIDLNDYTFIEDKTKLVAPICQDSEFTFNCLLCESDRKPALNVVKGVKTFIDKYLYNYYCQSSTSPLLDFTSFTFKRNDIKKELINKIDKPLKDRHHSLANFTPSQMFEHDFDNSLVLISHNPSWNMRVNNFADDNNDDISLTSNYSLNLPFQCRAKLFMQYNFVSIISTLIIIASSTIMFLYYRYAKLQASKEQQQIYDLIEKSIELLQSPDEPQSMVVLHIRDTLLSPSERKIPKYRSIWNKVVNHIENSESRVKVEYKKIDGEDFKAWKWIAPSTGTNYLTDSEIENDASLAAPPQTQKIGGIEWQGQAFAVTAKGSASNSNNDLHDASVSVVPTEVYRNKNFQALTRFLKIRNIFEKEAQYLDPNWNKKIKNTILEKTASSSSTGFHDIVHIEIEDTANEGLVYLKCATIAGATNAFHALHGWWCEKKLVSVKFLKEERYYQRFPHARLMTNQLKIDRF